MRDKKNILVRSGRGGDGCVAFRREKFIPRGGPDGGDGGRGGHVYIRARDKISTLQNIRNNGVYKAGNGQPGMGSRMNGKKGGDEFIDVPPGTSVYNAEFGFLMQDLVKPGDKIMVAKGGLGGRGNCHFATPENRVPRDFEPGMDGQELNIVLKYSIPSDVAVVGLPNSGKSTLVSVLTNSKTKIAEYPFSTTDVHLGVINISAYQAVRIIDTPALVDGSSEERGLGNRFLSHLRRVHVILYLLDPFEMEQKSLKEQLSILRKEIRVFDAEYAEKQQLIVVSKSDILDDEKRSEIEELKKNSSQDVIVTSAVSGDGIETLREWFGELDVAEKE